MMGYRRWSEGNGVALMAMMAGDDGGAVMIKMVECGRKWWRWYQYW